MDEHMMSEATTNAQEQNTTPTTDMPTALIASRTHIDVVGAVQLPQDRNGKHRDLRASQGTFRTRTTRLLLHIEEEDGITYGLNVDVPAHTAEREQIIAHLGHGDRVHVRGRLRTEPAFDVRFATDDNPAGRATRQMTVVVESIELADADAIDGTWLKMTGRTSTVADIREHEYGSDDRVGRTFLVVEWSEPSQRPGSRTTHTRIDRIPLDVPLAIDGCTSALRAGNLITVEGHLEPFSRYIDPKRNSAVNAYLSEFDDRRQAEYATLSPQERRRQERRDRRTLQNIRYEQGVRVRAGYIELHEGQPMSVDEARHARREFVKHQKQRKQSPEAQSTTQSDVPVPTEPNTSSDGDGGVLDMEVQGDRPTRHRRLATRAHVVAAAPVVSDGQHSD